MKHFGRFMLLTAALAVGGALGSMLLPDVEPLKMAMFLIACLILGEVFYQIDKRISQKQK